MTRTTILDACVQVLRKAGGPLSADEIHRGIVDANLFEFKAKDPRSVLRSALRKHLRGSSPHRVTEVSRGQYRST